MDRYTNERVRKILKKYIQKLNKKFKLDKVILFGSRARDEHLLSSDVDVIFISKDFEELNYRDRIAEVIGEWDEFIDLEPLCYTPKEFERKKKQIGIVSQANKEGIEI